MEKKINLLHIIGHIHPYGGLERKVMQLINHLDKNKYNVWLVGLSEYHKDSNKFIDNEINVVFLEKQEGVDFRLLVKLAQLLRENRIDIIHSHNWATLFYAVVAAKIARTAVVIHGEHGIETKNVEDSWKQFLLKRILFSRCTHLIAISLYIKNFMIGRYKIANENITLIYNGVETNNSSIGENRDKYNLSSYSHIIGTIGRIKPVKDFTTLISAFSVIKNKFPDAALVVVGPGNDENNPYYKRLINQIDELEIGEVFFLGPIKNIPKILSTFDVFVNSSIYEGISNTILEAMASKVPVVASNVGGNPELIEHENTGLLFASKNIDECTTCINKILEERILYEKIVEKAYQNILVNHSMASMFKKNQDLYQKFYKAKVGI